MSYYSGEWGGERESADSVIIYGWQSIRHVDRAAAAAASSGRRAPTVTQTPSSFSSFPLSSSSFSCPGTQTFWVLPCLALSAIAPERQLLCQVNKRPINILITFLSAAASYLALFPSLSAKSFFKVFFVQKSKILLKKGWRLMACADAGTVSVSENKWQFVGRKLAAAAAILSFDL